MAETSLGILMKEIGEALKYDNDNYDKEAYVKYTSCIYNLAGNLVFGVNLSGGDVVIGPQTTRYVKLLQQCVERVVALVSRMAIESAPKPASAVTNGSLPQVRPVASRPSDWKGHDLVSQKSSKVEYVPSPQTPSPHEDHRVSRPVPLHTPVPALPPENNPNVYSQKRKKWNTISPMEMAHKQNQSLLVAYKARMRRLNKADFNAFNYSLTIRRKMAENLAIAQNQEEELARKMKARQQRLEEEAARRFAVPIGMSSEEQEQRQMYKNILMYENEMETLQKWRRKLENSPEDPILICQLVQEVLRCSDHPLTEMLRNFQFKVYERAYPLVENKQRLIETVVVGLHKDLWPTKEDVADLLEISHRATSPPAPEVRRRRKGRSRGGKGGSDKTDVENKHRERTSTNRSSFDGENAKTSRLNSEDVEEKSDCSNMVDVDASVSTEAGSDNWNDPLNIRSEESLKREAGKDNTPATTTGVSHSNNANVSKNDTSSSDEKNSVRNKDTVEIKDAEGADVEEGENSVLAEKAASDSLDKNEADDTDSDRKEENATGMQENEPSAEDEESDTSTLTSASGSDSEDEGRRDRGRNAMRESMSDAKYNLEHAMEKGKQLESELSLQRKQAQLLMRQVTKEYENYTDENFDDLFEDDEEVEEEQEQQQPVSFIDRPANLPRTASLGSKPQKLERDSNTMMDRSKSMQTVHVDTPTEPPPNLFHSLPYMSGSDDSNEKEDYDQILMQLKEEAYARHLKAISEDIHTYLDKLLVLMIIAYELLDTPVGKDQCAVALEEPFFKPIWKTLLRLFRIVYHKEELILACVMTKYADASPKDLNIARKFWLLDESQNDKSPQPYQAVIDELRLLSEHYTVLSKLECLVKVCRLICKCVDKYYAEKENDGTVETSKKAPSLGADDLLPVFTYIIIRTKNPHIVSECYAMIEFIQESYMMGEEGYCLTTLRTAIAYTMSLYKNLL